MSDAASAVATLTEGVPADAPNIETPAVETPEVEAAQVDADVSQPEVSQQPTGEELQNQRQPQRTDARTLPRDMQQALKQLRGQNPAVAKALNDTYFRDQAMFGPNALFKDADEARATKAMISAIGGESGIAEMQRTLQAFHDMDDLIERGDPEVLDTMVEASPEGFKRLVPAAMEKLRGMDQQAFNDAVLPIFAESLQNAGLKEEILSSIEELRAGQDEQAGRRLAAIARWITGVEDQTGRMKSMRPDPRVSQYESRERELRQRDETSFRTNVGQGFMNYLNPKLEESLTGLWDGYNLTEDAKAKLAQDVFHELEAMFDKNDSYKAQLNALVRSRDYGKTLEFIKARTDIDLPAAAKAVWEARYGFMKPAPKPKPRPTTTTNGMGTQETPTGPTKTGKPIILPAKPSMDDLDMNAEGATTAYIAGRGIMNKGPYKGRVVQWRK